MYKTHILNIYYSNMAISEYLKNAYPNTHEMFKEEATLVSNLFRFLNLSKLIIQGGQKTWNPGKTCGLFT